MRRIPNTSAKPEMITIMRRAKTISTIIGAIKITTITMKVWSRSFPSTN